jgi:hypothetical protein
MDVGVAAVAPRRGVGEARAVVRPGGAAVARLAVRQQRDPAVLQSQPEKLIELSAANIAHEHDRVAIARRELPTQDALVAKRELLARAVRLVNDVQLVHLGETGGQQHRASLGMPVLKTRHPEVKIATHIGLQFVGEGRNALGDQVVRQFGCRN